MLRTQARTERAMASPALRPPRGARRRPEAGPADTPSSNTLTTSGRISAPGRGSTSADAGGSMTAVPALLFSDADAALRGMGPPCVVGAPLVDLADWRGRDSGLVVTPAWGRAPLPRP